MRSATRRKNVVRCSNAPPYLPRPVDRTEQLVEQVAVAVLHVDEVEAGALRELGGAGERLDERVEIVV